MAALAAVTVLAVSLNLHLALIQAAAWSSMLLDNQRVTQSWTEAARQTFNGEQPCHLCETVLGALQVTKSGEIMPLQRAFDESRVLPGLVLLWLKNTPPALYPHHSRALAVHDAERCLVGFMSAPEPPPPKQA